MWRSRIGLGCGGLLVLLLLLGIVGVIVGGGNQSTQQSSSPSPSPPPAPAAQPTPPSPSPSKSGTAATVRVSSSPPGMPFSGSYGSISSSQQSVDGSTPQDYEVPIKTGFGQLDVVSATMQKQAQDDSQLTVQIVSDGQVKKEASTTAQFGVVNVTWNTNE